MHKIAILILLSMSIVLGQKNYYKEIVLLSQEIYDKNANETEKEKSWKKLVTEIESNGKIEYDHQCIQYILSDVIVYAQEPFKEKAWSELKTNYKRSDSDFCIFTLLIMQAPVPYKDYAWNERRGCGKTALSSYTSLIAYGVEPYALWAWQNLENYWSLNDGDTDEYQENILSLFLFAKKPYKQWAWNKILNSQPSNIFLSRLLSSKLSSEPYAAMAWALISAKKPEEINEKEIDILKKISNEATTSYKIFALSKLLTLPPIARR